MAARLTEVLAALTVAVERRQARRRAETSETQAA